MFDSGTGMGVWKVGRGGTALRHLFPKVIHNTAR